MNSEMIRTADVLDILFEHRNKEYGAYVLRKGYHGRMLKAMYTVPAMVLIFFLVMNWNKNDLVQKAIVLSPFPEEVILREMKVPEPEKPRLPAQPPRQVATIKSVTPVIVPDQVPADPPPTVDEQAKAAIGTETRTGVEPAAFDPTPPTETGSGTGPSPAEPVKEEAVLKFAENMPQYPGGLEGLRRFLGRNLRVPEDAMEPGQRVRVPVRFVVERDGTVVNVEFLEKADEVFKKEILRVMGKMPKWVPGSQNGRAVAVYFAIPILFEVSE